MTVENHHFEWEKSLSMPFSIARLDYQRLSLFPISEASLPAAIKVDRSWVCFKITKQRISVRKNVPMMSWLYQTIWTIWSFCTMFCCLITILWSIQVYPISIPSVSPTLWSIHPPLSLKSQATKAGTMAWRHASLSAFTMWKWSATGISTSTGRCPRCVGFYRESIGDLHIGISRDW